MAWYYGMAELAVRAARRAERNEPPLAPSRPAHPCPVVCRLLLMLLCCTGGMVGIERLIGDYRRCNYEHEIAMRWWSMEAAVEALAVD